MTQEPTSSTKPDQQEKLLADILQGIRANERQLEKLNSHKLITAYNSTPQLLLLQFLKGGAFGLGSVAGAGIVVSIIAYLLSKVEFLPIIGEWTKVILQEINK